MLLTLFQYLKILEFFLLEKTVVDFEGFHVVSILCHQHDRSIYQLQRFQSSVAVLLNAQDLLLLKLGCIVTQKTKSLVKIGVALKWVSTLDSNRLGS